MTFLRPLFDWNGNANDISEVVNKGVFYVFHRDHGSPYSWGQPKYNQSNVNSLSNSLLPLVFSINCSTGRFDESECFAETWLRKSNGGSLGIIAAGADSPTNTNNVFSVGLFDNIVQSHLNGVSDGLGSILTFGEILSLGLEHVTNESGYGKRHLAAYERKIFHCFGDPSMVFYTAIPAHIDNLTVENREGRINISSGSEIMRMVVYDKTEDLLNVYDTNSINVENHDNHEIAVSISRKGFRPIVFNDLERVP